MEDVLNVMMEERRKMNEIKMTCIKKLHLVDNEQEMTRIHLEDKKLDMEKMKIKLDMQN